MKKTAQKIFLGIAVLGLVMIPLLTLFGQPQTTAFYEQRRLAALPKPTMETVLNGAYFTELETYYQDHIFGRDYLLKLNTGLELLLDRVVVSNIVVNSDKMLDKYSYSVWDLGYLNADAAVRAEEYAALSQQIQAYGGYFCYLGIPQHTTYFADRYPEYMESRLWHTTGIREAFSKAFAERGVPFINMYEEFQKAGRPEEYYFSTDHHYSTEGAFFAYTALMEYLQENADSNLSFLEKEDFVWTTLENAFLGSSNRKLYGLWENDDRVTVAEPAEKIPYTRTDNGKAREYIYQLPSDTGETISYNVYMGGDIAETVIQTNRPELPSVLIYGDSFSNPIETFVWANFDETRCLDLRYYTGKTLTEYIAEYQPDYVVCIRDESTYFSKTGNGVTK